MIEKLKTIYKIQKVLESNGYYDMSRISEEIYDFCNGKEDRITMVLERIAHNEPWEYIRGETEFYGNVFKVTKSVLIPRIETEDLVEIAVSLLKKNAYKTVVDIGTGSGCIIISLAKYFHGKKDINFVGIDICKRALSVAEKNAVLHKVNDKVLLEQGNLLSNRSIENDTLLIANLPYIPRKMYESLEKSVKDYEPQKALDGGDDGLKYYRKLVEQIVREGKKVLLLIEFEPSTKDILKEILPKEATCFSDFKGVERFALVHFS